MLNVAFYFQVHQPARLRKYLFFDIGKKRNYYDDTVNRTILQQVVDNSYLPANEMFQQLVDKYGDRVKLNYILSGTVLDQMERYSPRTLESFQQLFQTGQAELLGTTYSHSLSFLQDEKVFSMELEQYAAKAKELFNQAPKVYGNTCLLYSDQAAKVLTDHDYEGVLTESPGIPSNDVEVNRVYGSKASSSLKILLRHPHLSDDLSLRFSNRSWDHWPLSPRTYVSWLKKLGKKDKTLNLWMDYGAIGEHQNKDTGIFEFMEELFTALAEEQSFKLSTASELIGLSKKPKSLAINSVVSCADDRTLSPWLENDMQQEAYDTLYAIHPKIEMLSNSSLLKDWSYLQGSDHFYYMSTKYENEHKKFSPYASPYDAFINYMNVLADFTLRVEKELKRPKAKV